MKIENNTTLKDKKILIVATGSIAVVKTPLLVSNLIKMGAQVRCVITHSASQLVSPISLAVLSRNPCYQDHDQWNPKEARPLHIALSEWADIIIVAPLSASSLSRWVNGIGEGLAASLLLATERPVIAAAAMNTAMWNNPAVKRNWQNLKSYSNIITLEPAAGLLACDRLGDGRMANIELIQLAIESAIIQSQNHSSIKKDFKGIHLLITAGATIEDIDAARYLTNRSSGRMGVLLGQAARLRGATVDLIHGELTVKQELLEGINHFEARNAGDMQKNLRNLQSSADVIAMTAAICDIKPKIDCSSEKIPKEELFASFKNRFELIPDLITEIVQKKTKNQILLGFSALTGSDEEIKKLALIKKNKKGCDLLMANPVDRLNQGFSSNFNSGWLLGEEGHFQEMHLDCKLSLAHKLLDALKTHLIAISKKK